MQINHSISQPVRHMEHASDITSHILWGNMKGIPTGWKEPKAKGGWRTRFKPTFVDSKQEVCLFIATPLQLNWNKLRWETLACEGWGENPPKNPKNNRKWKWAGMGWHSWQEETDPVHNLIAHFTTEQSTDPSQDSTATIKRNVRIPFARSRYQISSPSTCYRLQCLKQWIRKNEQTLMIVNGFHFPGSSPKSQFY